MMARMFSKAALPLVALAVSTITSLSMHRDSFAATNGNGAKETSSVPHSLSVATVALGGFRGLVADILWLRAQALQEDRKFVELMQLSSWITNLEPENEDVWVFHAWNMAYNVSFLMSRPDDRWRWVRSGIDLLRSQGIELNSGSARLKCELAWIFRHKIGEISDSASGYYRTQWARQIGAYLAENGHAPEEGSISEEELMESEYMNPDFMRTLESRFGPIDWRVPCAASLYWGALALEQEPDDSMALKCSRMVYSSLMSMATNHGSVIGDTESADWEFDAVPNLAIIDSTVLFLEQTMQRHSFAGVRFAYMGFLRDAALIQLSAGNLADSHSLINKLNTFLTSNNIATRLPPIGINTDPNAWDSLFQQAILELERNLQ